jgi:hypothetical protein
MDPWVSDGPTFEERFEEPNKFRIKKSLLLRELEDRSKPR